MKKLRKVLALVLAMVMVLAMGVTAFAQTTTYTGKDATTNGTVTVTNAAKGSTYTLYKLFDATYSSDGAVAYSTTKDLGDGTTWFNKDASNNITLKKDADITKDEFKTWAKLFGTKICDAVEADGSQVVFEKVPYGYYFLDSTLGSNFTVTTAKPNIEVIDKNTQTPGSDKDKNITKVTDGNTNAEVSGAVNNDGEKATAKIGDKISYSITFTATNYATSGGQNASTSEKVTYYTVADTPSGLSIDVNSLKVLVGTQEITSSVLSDTATTVSATGLNLNLAWIDQSGKSIYNTPVTVTITYDATLTSVTDGQASNSATVNYNGKNTDTPDAPVVETATFKMVKVDSVNIDTTLTGAEFDLYDSLTGGNQIKVKNVDGTYTVDPNGNAKIIVDSNGQATIYGLKESTTYYLEETKAPSGYTVPTARISITTGSTTDIPTADTKITNTKGIALPSTGGIGTTIFYVIGAFLVIGAGVVLVTRRRMAK